MQKRGLRGRSATSLCTEQRCSGDQLWARGDDAWGLLQSAHLPARRIDESLLTRPILVDRGATTPPTPTSGACMTDPYQRRHPCSHLLPTALGLHGRFTGGRASRQSLTALPACCTHCKAWRPRYCARRAAATRHECCECMYTRASRRLEPTRRSDRHYSVCQPAAATPKTQYIQPHTIYHRALYRSCSHGRLSQPAALPSVCPSVRYSGRAHTTLCPPPRASPRTTRAVDSQRRRRALWRPWVAGCLGSAPHRLHRLCA